MRVGGSSAPTKLIIKIGIELRGVGRRPLNNTAQRKMNDNATKGCGRTLVPGAPGAGKLTLTDDARYESLLRWMRYARSGCGPSACADGCSSSQARRRKSRPAKLVPPRCSNKKGC